MSSGGWIEHQNHKMKIGFVHIAQDGTTMALFLPHPKTEMSFQDPPNARPPTHVAKAVVCPFQPLGGSMGHQPPTERSRQVEEDE